MQLVENPIQHRKLSVYNKQASASYMHVFSTISDDVYALSSHQLLAHDAMLSLFHNLNLRVVIGELQKS